MFEIGSTLSSEEFGPRDLVRFAARAEETGFSFALVSDPESHLTSIREYADVGFDHVYVHQIGKDQEGFFPFYEREVLPKL